MTSLRPTHMDSSDLGSGESVLQALDDALPSTPEGAAVELLAMRQQLGLTRFSRRRIHHNVEDWSTRVWVRAWTKHGYGWSCSDDLSRGAIERAVERATSDYHGRPAKPVPLPWVIKPPDVDTYSDQTAQLNSAARAEVAREATEAGGEIDVSGNLRTSIQDLTLANTAGLRIHVPLTYAAFNVVASAPGSSGYGCTIGRRAEKLDFAHAVANAVDTARQARDPVAVPNGRYRVILEPPAVSMLLVMLGAFGLNSFSGAAGIFGTFITGNLGQRVGSDLLTLEDDPLDPDGLPTPWDAEGTPRRPLTLIDHGIAVGVAHDLSTALAAGTDTTGHALPAGTPLGPAPLNLRVPPGAASREDLIRQLGDGLIINRIHPFVSLRGGPEGNLSGTTVDGVFIVRDGEVVGPAKNLRWTNNATDVFRSIEAASAERSIQWVDVPGLPQPHTSLLPSILCGELQVHATQPME